MTENQIVNVCFNDADNLLLVSLSAKACSDYDRDFKIRVSGNLLKTPHECATCSKWHSFYLDDIFDSSLYDTGGEKSSN